jgi:hypothetical protein
MSGYSDKGLKRENPYCPDKMKSRHQAYKDGKHTRYDYSGLQGRRRDYEKKCQKVLDPHRGLY